MLFQPEDKIPKGVKEQIPLGMIGQMPVELKRNIFQILTISTPDAQFEVVDETPAGISKKIQEVVKFFTKCHPELLYKH
jgi:hypothetical protein